MRILFYIEPVAFRHDHLALSPIMNLVRCIINANKRDDVSYGLATSSALLSEYDRWLAHGGLVTLYRKTISERDILRTFDFDHVAYAKCLFSAGELIEPLEDVFKQIESEFAPDVIVCFTQNSMIENLLPQKLVLFAERGPLPRWNGVDNTYFEAGGHQPRSIFARRLPEIAGFQIEEERAIATVNQFRQIQAALPASRDAIPRFKEWSKAKLRGRKVAMIANQPHDSLLIAGAAEGISLERFMMSSMEALPEDWFAFATYHPDAGDCSKLDQRVSASFPNFVALPPELRQFGSDVFASEIDAVVTVGSKAAFPAALLGKKIVANPATMLAGMSVGNAGDVDGAPSLNETQAGRVLAFLSHRFTLSHENLLQTNGYWLAHLEAMLDSESYESFLLDASNYSHNSFDRMFGR